jgi:glucosamine-6-phosphate deaminase
METLAATPRLYRAGTLKFEIYPNRQAAGEAAAMAAAGEMIGLGQMHPDVAVIFATGASQLSMLHALTSLPGIPWNRITGFHMDEYQGMHPDHFASFRRYLREQLVEKVPIKVFHEIDGTSTNPEEICHAYAHALAAAKPQLCLLGIGENGHLAFNDPFVSDFNDQRIARLADLDQACREQQVAEGWFPSLDTVPAQAITLTIPALFQVPKLIVSVPGKRKAHIVRRVIEEAISMACPATILKTHPDATVYLDDESSAELEDLLASSPR